MLVENVIRFLEHRELESTYDGHANCFIETGFGKALLIDFNYETERCRVTSRPESACRS